MEDAPFSFIRVGREMGTVGHINCHRSRRRANTACIDPYAMGDWKERLHGMVWGPVYGVEGERASLSTASSWRATDVVVFCKRPAMGAH